MPGPSNLSRSIAARPDSAAEPPTRETPWPRLSRTSRSDALRSFSAARLITEPPGLHSRPAACLHQCSMEMQPCPSRRDRRSSCFGDSAVSETRKLAAILVADIVGYSRLAGADEDRILARLRTLRSDLIDPTIAVHHGRVVKRTGDGSIIEFRSVVDAVRCAIEVQSGLAVSSQPLMEHSCRVIRRMRYGTGSSRGRHDDSGGPSSDTA